MSGKAADTPSDTADLVGPVMVRLVGAIPHVQELLSQPVIVGGLAVMIRLGTSHRATQDLDALRRRHEGGATGLEILSAAGATEIDEVGGTLTTDRGDVRVDVLESGPHELDRTFTDATDRLEATAHVWTLETAFAATDPQLRADVATHVEQQFRRNHLRTRRLINGLNSPQVDDDLISGAIEFLDGVLSTS